MKDPNSQYTLITGASTGLGKAFALECAHRKMNLVLSALPNENLEDLTRQLRQNHGIKVFYKETDLTNRVAVEEFAQWATSNFSINILINNAGIGGTQHFIDSTTTYLDDMIQLNIRAMTLLTRLLLPSLKQQTPAHILNVSSLAAFSPVPYKTIYPASKAFIHHFSRGLEAELQDTNVRVSVLNPGPIMTNSDVCKRIDAQSSYVKLSIMTPEQVAQIALKKMLRGKSVIIPGLMNRINAFFIRLVPVNFRIFVGTQIFKRENRKTRNYEGTRNRSKQPAWKQPDQKAAASRLQG
ncbi:SDR family oxidoreductase [uncultured Sunxiuqinia sp.]|uniref:SDR family NAD(P)-dependent oxidoreductase n=1 Tax=uncultured Sunxiuqinia sp. TaxID=1573825 RepID=UPI002620769E|nr:SDR family oxidoreductase [uncultured Sunxiuqinia sp.]